MHIKKAEQHTYSYITSTPSLEEIDHFNASCTIYCNIQGLFAKFVDSPYYSESELRGGVVMSLFQSTSLGK